MEGLGILLGHLVGDYLVQNDWMAANKGNPKPGPAPSLGDYSGPERLDTAAEQGMFASEFERYRRDCTAWHEGIRKWHEGNAACIVHCTLYTLAVFAFAYWWLSLWGVLAIFATHYALDRYKLARVYMRYMGQEAFATKLGPWSVIVVDNTFHLLTAYVVWGLHR